MIRRLFASASVLSLLLWVVFAVAWVRAQFASDFIDHARGRRMISVVVIDRSLFVGFFHRSEPMPVQGWAWSRDPADPGFTFRHNPTILGKAGFYSDLSKDDSRLSTTWIIGVPFWLLCLLTAAPPLAFAASSRRKRIQAARRKSRLCLSCGYDLRASTHRCPECGTPIPVAS